MKILSHIFDDKFLTDIPLVYKGKTFKFVESKPFWISLIGPSGSGKDTLKQRLTNTNRFHLVVSATNRKIRPGEKTSDYIWMRQKLDNEPENAYLRKIIKEYNLFEYNYHYGNMYGTPFKSIKNAIASKKTVLYVSDNQGALFMENLLSDFFNFLTISIVPDSIEELEERIIKGGRDNPGTRLRESLEKISSSRKDSHFILKNPSSPIQRGKSGLDSATYSLKTLIFKYI